MLVAAAAVAAGGVWAPSGHAACAPLIYWGGHPYQGYGPVPVETGAAVPGAPARRPACGDRVADGRFVPGKDHYMRVNTIRGVAPGVAVVGEGDVYVNRSTFVALPSHPLHKKLWKGGAERVSGPRCTVTGKAVIDVYGFAVKSARIVVTPRTRVLPRRYGTGYVANGARVRVVGRACERQDGELVVKARRIYNATAAPSPADR
jgi:hypothetical protein